MAPGDDTDSGMGSQNESEAGRSGIISDKSDLTSGSVALKEDIDEPDETLSERLWGLTEMFPEPVRNATYTVATTTKSSLQGLYGFSRSAFWVLFSSSIILFAPVIFEVERVQMEEAQRTQQKQMLLGPNTAVSSGGLPLMPQMRH
ncbi:hypothetical protein PPYR_11224 [Photinus pyralis]|uniref:Mitochondrial import receptor subunit TOM22 homolog n=2 Tax=Photinus pyralis TaxID=7054 RepID=A0A1Y1KKU7_PHOPY|nr:mitochondrial import receptor subunit TOM22 homolog isoform X1 [Photinus pyralis]KAB0794385.1 hypothetical protein PPYR_11224 [Photinus pyralis]